MIAHVSTAEYCKYKIFVVKYFYISSETERCAGMEIVRILIGLAVAAVVVSVVVSVAYVIARIAIGCIDG